MPPAQGGGTLGGMKRLRSVIAFFDRYVTLAGRSCCAGRSWVSLDRSLARRAKDGNC